jgi:hypothetical protein
MDEQDPLNQKPVSSHPNSVQTIPVSHGREDEAPTPRKFEPLPPNYHKNPTKKGRYAFIAVVVLLIIGAAVYWFLLKPKPATAPTSVNSSSSSRNSQSTQAKLDTEHYESSNFNLGFDHPKDWKVSDVSGSGKLTVTSPVMKLTDSDNQKVDGQIIMTIRDKTQKLSEIDKGAAAAILDSEKIAYTKPAETQRGNTYISFLNYASSTGSNAAGIDGIYITGDAGYQKDQEVPAVDISKIDPIINVIFMSNNKAITIDSKNWSDNSFSKPIKTLVQSLAIH